MANNQSLSQLVKGLDAQVRQVLRKLDIPELSLNERKFISNLRQNLADTRINVTAYELSMTRQEQLRSAQTAKKCLAAAEKNILSASEYNIFGAIDVAHLSAQIETIKEGLQ